MATSVGIQYANALFEIAKEENQVKEYREELNVAKEVLIDNQNVYKTLIHPKVTIEERKEIINKTFKEYVAKNFLHFLYVLIDNNRLSDLPDIVDAFEKLYQDSENYCIATVYVKYPLTEEEKKVVVNCLTKKIGKEIHLKEIVAQSLIAGIKIEVDGKIIDASMLKEMTDLKKELKKGW